MAPNSADIGSVSISLIIAPGKSAARSCDIFRLITTLPHIELSPSQETKHARPFRFLTEQKAMARFFILKGINPRDIHTGLL
jgi:hypothetical protein